METFDVGMIHNFSISRKMNHEIQERKTGRWCYEHLRAPFTTYFQNKTDLKFISENTVIISSLVNYVWNIWLRIVKIILWIYWRRLACCSTTLDETAFLFGSKHDYDEIISSAELFSNNTVVRSDNIIYCLFFQLEQSYEINRISW